MWARLLVIPWLQSYEGREDRTLEERLWAEAPGILRWLVLGCMAYLQEGLHEPEASKRATAQYRQSEDQVGRWLADESAAAAEVGGERKYSQSREWAEAQGEGAMAGRAFGAEMKRHGFIQRRTATGRAWVHADEQPGQVAELNFGGTGR